MDNNPVGAIVAVVIIGVVALFGISILGSLGVVAVDLGTTSGDAAFNPTVGESQTLDTNVDEAPSFWKVSLTKGNGVQLDGNGYVAAETPSGWDNASWTACATGRLADGANPEATYALLAVENESILIQYDAGHWTGYYDNGTSEASVTLPAQNPGSLSSVCLAYNDTEDTIELHADGQDSSPESMGSATRNLSLDWQGTVDEVRFFDQELSNATEDRYSTHPAAGLGVEDSGRYMLDEGSGSTSKAYYMDASATLVGGASWGSGVASPELEQGADYQVSVNPLEITPSAGGLIDSSPILYVEWATGLSGTFASVLEGTGSALTLIPVLLIVILASVIIAATARLRQ